MSGCLCGCLCGGVGVGALWWFRWLLCGWLLCTLEWPFEWQLCVLECCRLPSSDAEDRFSRLGCVGVWRSGRYGGSAWLLCALECCSLPLSDAGDRISCLPAVLPASAAVPACVVSPVLSF